MPKIDTYTAQTTPVVPDQPLRFMATGESPATGLSQQVTQLSEKWSSIYSRIEAQKNVLSYDIAKNELAASVHNALLDTTTDPEVIQDPSVYERKFGERLRDIRSNMLKDPRNANIQGQLGQLFAEEGPGALFQARATGLKLATDHNMALLDLAKDSNATLAAEALATGNPEAAKGFANGYARDVEDAVRNNHLSKDAAVRRIQDYQDTTAAKYMTTLANSGSTSRNKLRDLSRNGEFDGLMERNPNLYYHIMGIADQKEAQEDARSAAVKHNTENLLKRDLLGRLSTGDLPQETIDLIKDNKTMLDPQFGYHLQEIKDKQATEKKVRDPAVAAIATEYGMKGPPSMARNAAERARLTQHVLENGPSEDSRIRFDHLDAEYNTMRGVAAQETHQALDYADRSLKASEEPSFGGAHTQARRRNQESIDRAQIERDLLQPGADKSKPAIDKRIKELRDRRKQARDSRSETQKQSDEFSNEGR
jgi:hypothetical protein